MLTANMWHLSHDHNVMVNSKGW